MTKNRIKANINLHNSYPILLQGQSGSTSVRYSLFLSQEVGFRQAKKRDAGFKKQKKFSKKVSKYQPSVSQFVNHLTYRLIAFSHGRESIRKVSAICQYLSAGRTKLLRSRQCQECKALIMCLQRPLPTAGLALPRRLGHYMPTVWARHARKTFTSRVIEIWGPYFHKNTGRCAASTRKTSPWHTT